METKWAYIKFLLYICPFFVQNHKNLDFDFNFGHTAKENYLYAQNDESILLIVYLALCKISRVKLIIFSFFFHEFVMAATLDDASLL